MKRTAMAEEGILTLFSAPVPPSEPTSASATEGPLPGARAGCHLPHTVSVAATSTPTCDDSPAVQIRAVFPGHIRFAEV
jgi:hypothetical protein